MLQKSHFQCWTRTAFSMLWDIVHTWIIFLITQTACTLYMVLIYCWKCLNELMWMCAWASPAQLITCGKKQRKANTTAIKTHHNKITLPFPHPSIQISQYKKQERNGAIKNSCNDFQRSVMGERLHAAILLSLYVGSWGGGMQMLVVGFYSGQYLRRNAGLCSATVCSW